MSMLIEQLRISLGTDLPPATLDPELKLAAVLALLYPVGGEYKIVLTKRTSLVGSHRGEMCLPGGRFEPDVDHSLKETALRESAEEIGLVSSNVEVLGSLEPRATRFGYLVSPYVGLLKLPQEFIAQPTEVDAIFEIPLAHLMAPDALSSEPRVYSGTQVSTPYFTYQDHVIWGATARILRQLLALLEPDALAAPAGVGQRA